LKAAHVMPRVGIDLNLMLFDAAEHFMSAFSCDLVKIVSVAGKITQDVALHLTLSRGAHFCHASKDNFFNDIFLALIMFPGSTSSSRQVFYMRTLHPFAARPH
jgi:hypothetical protein